MKKVCTYMLLPVCLIIFLIACKCTNESTTGSTAADPIIGIWVNNDNNIKIEIAQKTTKKFEGNILMMSNVPGGGPEHGNMEDRPEPPDFEGGQMQPPSGGERPEGGPGGGGPGGPPNGERSGDRQDPSEMVFLSDIKATGENTYSATTFDIESRSYISCTITLNDSEDTMTIDNGVAETTWKRSKE